VQAVHEAALFLETTSQPAWERRSESAGLDVATTRNYSVMAEAAVAGALFASRLEVVPLRPIPPQARPPLVRAVREFDRRASTRWS
jgi:hypothetical protein